jgi:hypothetical protein
MKHLLFGLVFALSVAGCGDDDDSPATDAAPDDDPDATAGDDDAAPGGADAGDDDDAAPTPDAGPSPYPTHFIRRACAPNDGPAVRMLLGHGVDGALCTLDPVSSSVNIELWTQDIEAPGTYLFSARDPLGAGQVCIGGDGPCVIYQEGEIVFDTFELDVGASGTWRLFGDRGFEESGTFDATWCDPDPPEPCG